MWPEPGARDHVERVEAADVRKESRALVAIHFELA